MSAGFKIAGEVYWGTNGAVEACVEAMAALAAERFGPADPIATYLAEQRDSFSLGRVLYLDEWLIDAPARGRFLGLLDAAGEQLLRQGTFTEYGREWMASVVPAMRAQIAADAGPGS